MGDPIHQFEIKNFFHLGNFAGWDLHFTNSALFMILAVGLTALLMLGTTARRQLVPGRLQSLAELSYEFVENTIRSTAGEEGLRFFPLVFSLFMFILISNVVGLIPYTFTVQPSHHHGGAGAARVLHRHHLRHLEERSEILQAVRAERRADLHYAADRVHRGAVVPVAAGVAF